MIVVFATNQYYSSEHHRRLCHNYNIKTTAPPSSLPQYQYTSEHHRRLCHNINTPASTTVVFCHNYNINTIKTTAVNEESTTAASTTVVFATGKTPLVSATCILKYLQHPV